MGGVRAARSRTHPPAEGLELGAGAPLEDGKVAQRVGSRGGPGVEDEPPASFPAGAPERRWGRAELRVRRFGREGAVPAAALSRAKKSEQVRLDSVRGEALGPPRKRASEWGKCCAKFRLEPFFSFASKRIFSREPLETIAPRAPTSLGNPRNGQRGSQLIRPSFRFHPGVGLCWNLVLAEGLEYSSAA